MSELDASQEAERQRKSQRTFLLVAAVCIAPFVGSFLLYFFWQPAGRINYGELVEGASLPAVSLVSASGKPLDLGKLRGRWIFVTVDSSACDAYCQNKLWQMRQVRLTQGKYLERIERLWLLTDAAPVAPAIEKEYEGMHISQGVDAIKSLPAKTALRDHIWLVDPLGNVVLRYPKDADPSRMKKDLERVLKASRIG